MMEYRGDSSRSVHSGEVRDPSTGSVTTPIYQTSNFAFEDTDSLVAVMSEKQEGYVYTRYGNPTVRAVEKKLADLERTEDAVAFSSGMAAVATTIMTLVSTGDHIVSSQGVYGGTFILLNGLLRKFGVEVTFVDPLHPEEMDEAVKPNTKLIYVESPTNPTLRLVDLDMVSETGKKRGIRTVIDNTFASPINQRPKEHGFDIIVHSATKYLGGHNDVTAGLVCGDRNLVHAIKENLKTLGGVLDPHCAYLLLRGMKTLAVRVEKHNRNGMEVAGYLETHPKVSRVHYPGLRSHPQHALARKQMRGFGGVVSFELKGKREASKFVDRLKMAYLTPSLGGAETLVTQPATTSHYKVSPQDRAKQGITDDLVRLSLGIEDSEDIISDLEQAFSKV
jgi:cystathionine beta-lyase/cystathionine gamma-synthase